MPSFYVDLPTELLCTQNEFKLEGSEHHHLAIVTRHRVGDRIKVINGRGWIGEADVLSISKKESTMKIASQIAPQEILPFAIAFSLLKNQNDELLVEKCTELGCTDFFPFQSRFSVKKSSPGTVSRFVKTSLAAIKQCDNPFLPTIHDVKPLHENLNDLTAVGYIPIICSERRPELWIADLDAINIKPCFVIGPEGGWSDEEYELFDTMGLGQFSISKLITRAETAAIAAAAQWAGKHSSN